MKYKYFSNIKTTNQAKKRYIDLVKKYHPDKNPELSEKECNSITSEIIDEYKIKLNEIDRIESSTNQDETEPKEDEPHKSPTIDFYSNIKGKTSQKPNQSTRITRNQAKKGIDILFDGWEWLQNLKK